MLTGEYLVLDGASSLAIPCKLGQSLSIGQGSENELQWKSKLVDGSTWLDTVFDISKLKANAIPHKDPIIQMLADILRAASLQNPDFLDGISGKRVTTQLEFPRNWGLGSSSTLIANIAEWAQIDPYTLLKNTFKGSGYDIACAKAEKAIRYQLKEGVPFVEEVHFKPSFANELYFVHLNQKQNSRESIAHYSTVVKIGLQKHADKISQITNQIIQCSTITQFENLLEQHEAIVSNILQTSTIKQSHFQDYPRAIKSLGGWGGDFVLAVGGPNDIAYFKKRGYKTIIPYKDMVLKTA